VIYIENRKFSLPVCICAPTEVPLGIGYQGDSIKYEPDDPNVEVFLFTKLILVINRSMFLLCRF